MLNQKLENAINEQIRHEFYSSYLYLAMSAWCESANLPGFAAWMKAQSDEEREHGMKLFGFLHDRGAKVQLRAIEQPVAEFKSPQQLFGQVLEHEQKVTASIHRLYELALAEKDYPTQILLQWFINEQVEEEKSASAILEQLKQLPEHGGAIFYLDKQLGKRGKEN